MYIPIELEMLVAEDVSDTDSIQSLPSILPYGQSKASDPQTVRRFQHQT